jgi:hypothetical protein
LFHDFKVMRQIKGKSGKRKLPRRKAPAASANPLIALRGIAKEIFNKLGGGEQFIRTERNDFRGSREVEIVHE